MKIFLTIALLLPGLVYSSEFKKFNTETIVFSDSTIPYLVKHPNLIAMNTYNTELKKAISKLKCIVPKKLKDKTFWEVFTGVGLVNNDLISVKIRSNYNCDNLRTISNEDTSITFDFATRRIVNLSDLFFKKPSTMKTIRSKLYAKLTGQECRNKLNFFIESESLFKDYLSFYLSKEGIVLQMKIPFGLRSCIKDAFISYKEISENTSFTSTLKASQKLK